MACWPGAKHGILYLEREPTEEEPAEATGQRIAEIRITLGASQRQASLHAPLDMELDACLLDVLEDGEVPMPDADVVEAKGTGIFADMFWGGAGSWVLRVMMTGCSSRSIAPGTRIP